MDLYKMIMIVYYFIAICIAFYFAHWDIKKRSGVDGDKRASIVYGHLLCAVVSVVSASVICRLVG